MNQNMKNEIIERLELLKSLGMQTEIDITKEYAEGGELCCSLLKEVNGTPVAIVNRISSEKPIFGQILMGASEMISDKGEIFFLLESMEGKYAFLLMANEPSLWDDEKKMLKNSESYALVFDVLKMEADIHGIDIKMLNGAPIFEFHGNW